MLTYLNVYKLIGGFFNNNYGQYFCSIIIINYILVTHSLNLNRYVFSF